MYMYVCAVHVRYYVEGGREGKKDCLVYLWKTRLAAWEGEFVKEGRI